MPASAQDRLAFHRVPAKAAAPVADAARLDAKALLLLRPEQPPREFVEALARQELYRDAVRFLAFALPPREAVWWACLGTLMLQAGHLHKEDALALTAAVRWVLEPNEAHRQEAEARVNEGTPAGLVARAVAWTGGSVRPPSLPALAPGPDFPHRSVFLALMRAVTAGPADKLPERFRQAVALGMHVARGHYSWNQPPLKAAAAPRITGS
jgi:hypothetical protein